MYETVSFTRAIFGVICGSFLRTVLLATLIVEYFYLSLLFL